ncbi:unnamed protein product, partial [Rotaria sp. Silwood2]
MTIRGQSFKLEEEPLRCKIIHGNTCQSRNLLRIIGIENVLRLNILLNIVPRNRLASIINYPYPINEYTRFIHYSYKEKTEKLPEDIREVRNLIQSVNLQTNATHIIASIDWGIEAIIIIRLSSNNNIVTQIDKILKKVESILKGASELTTLNSDDARFLGENTTIIVYSNISYLNGMTSMNDICQFINKRNEVYKVFRPLEYTLKPIELFNPQYNRLDSPIIQLESTYNEKLEEYLLKYLDKLKDLKYSLDYEVTKMLNGYLGEQLCQLQQQWVYLKNLYENDIKQLKHLINDVCYGRGDISIIDKTISPEKQNDFDDKFNKVTKNLNDLKEKGKLIRNLKEKKIQYCNVVEYGIDQIDNKITIEQKLVFDNEENRILYSNDHLIKINTKQFHTLLDNLCEQRRKHSEICLIYADFSYSSFELKDMMIVPSKRHSDENKKSMKEETLSSTSNIINILLLGETGVGKSTFINAFANYLTFNTLEKAQTSQPMVLMPVSFVTTVGDNFEEHTVKFGDVDSLNNEVFDRPGQSVTQRCKSYVFNLNDSDRKKLRIIDTPGFGDTRGIEQDDRNMEHILEYLSNFTHLNAICFLLKPNSSRLNIFFRSCLTQLFSLLDRNALNNIIFCFTSARSTFYTPGDTAPLVKKMLNSLSIGDVPFKKENTFCFDNESFRYLVALQNGIKFNDDEKHEYEMSWSTSVTQSKRLIDYIRKNVVVYHIEGNLQSMKYVQFEIIHMIRPILETMRNYLRNLILRTQDSVNVSLELYPKVISFPATICISCVPYSLLVGQFWIAKIIPHKIQNNHCTCECSLDQHISIDYKLEYKLSKKSFKYNQDKISDMLRELCHA